MKLLLTRLALVALALVLSLSFSACASTGSEDKLGQQFEVDAPSENVLWAVSGQELQRLDFPVGSEADPAKRVMLTGWRTSLAPFRGKGHRERAELRFESLGSARFRIHVSIERENNMNLSRPIDPSYAEWEAAGQDESTAIVLIQRIKGRMGEKLEVGPEQRRPAF